MQVFVTRDIAEFAEHTRYFLTRRPIEHNVLATVVAALDPTDCTDAPLFAWVEAGGSGAVSGAALRTPPRRVLASSMSAEAADALMPRLLEVDPELPGVNGPQPAASYLADAWRRCTGSTSEPGMSQAIYWLAHVDAPRRLAAGHFRPADRSDRDLMIKWARAFNRDAGVPATDVESGVERRLRDRRLFVWEDGRVVSMVGTSPPVAGVVRLGPVYTPPAARRHGYATALVAAVTPAGARRRRDEVHALHRPRQRNLQQHLPGGRLPALQRRPGVPLQQRRTFRMRRARLPRQPLDARI